MRSTTTLLIHGSSVLTPPPPPPPPLPKHAFTTTNPKRPKPPPRPLPVPPSSSPSSQSHRPPLLSTVLWREPYQSHHLISYYAELASKLAEDGRFDDFFMIVETVATSGGGGGFDVQLVKFAALLNLQLVSKGILSVIESDGGVRSLIRVLTGFQKLGIGSASGLLLFDRSVVEAIGRASRRILNCNVEEVIDLMETLSGFRISVEDAVEPIEVIKHCVNKRNPNAAIRYAGFCAPSDELFCTIILEFGKKGDLASAVNVFEASKCNLGYVNMYAYRTIIDACGLCRNHLRSRSIYEELLAQEINPNLYVFNSLMNVNSCDLTYTMHIYKHMQNLGVAPDMASYNILLKSCCLAARLDLAQEIYREVEYLETKESLKLDVFTYSTMIKVFADARMWQMALGIKEKMLQAGVTPNAVTWSSLISACAKAGLVDQAFVLFEEMVQAGCVPNSQCCNVLLYVCVKAFQYDRAFRLFQSWKRNSFQMAFGDHYNDTYGNITNMPNLRKCLLVSMKIPFKPTTSTYNILMKACGTDHLRAKALMDEMKRIGLRPNHITWSSLIGVYGGSGDVKSAVQILKTMRESGVQPDVIAYTAAIKVCVKQKELNFAFSLFAEMKRYQIQPNLVTYNTLLRARTRYGSLEEVQQCLAMYQDMRKAGFKPNDYYLKELIEEWCEGIIQGSHRSHGHTKSSNTRDMGGPHSLLLEKVASHLQKGNAEAQSIAVDLRGLTKVEARIVVLAVLRMIKENYHPGEPIKEDMLIVLGIQEVGVGAVADKHKLDLKDTIIKLLQENLSLEVLSLEPKIPSEIRINVENPFNPHPALQKTIKSPTRRPAVLQRLKVTRTSLNHWLRKNPKEYTTHNTNFVDD